MLHVILCAYVDDCVGSENDVGVFVVWSSPSNHDACRANVSDDPVLGREGVQPICCTIYQRGGHKFCVSLERQSVRHAPASFLYCTHGTLYGSYMLLRRVYVDPARQSTIM